MLWVRFHVAFHLFTSQPIVIASLSKYRTGIKDGGGLFLNALAGCIAGVIIMLYLISNSYPKNKASLSRLLLYVLRFRNLHKRRSDGALNRHSFYRDT